YKVAQSAARSRHDAGVLGAAM
ncbi:hypothetical protein QLF86_24750, partial [Salmonella enterica subsp. enterica serovar Oslo]